MYNGATVPARLFPLPPSPSNHQSSGCWYVAARGSLVLQGGHFRYSEAFEDSCTNAVLFEGEIGGNYAQDGRNLSFTVPGLGTVGTFTGTADGRDVTIRPDEDERTYRKLQ